MDAIEVELEKLLDEQKKLLDEQKNIEGSFKAAVETLAQSRRGLSDSKARQNEVVQRVASLQRFVTNLKNSTLAVKEQRVAAVRELEEAKTFCEDIFETVSKDVDKKALEAMESAEASLRESEEKSKARMQEVREAETARNTAQTDANAAETRMRDLSMELTNLPNQIESARQRLAALMTSARNAFATGKAGQTFLTLRDLEIQSEELSKLAAEDASQNLLGEIETARNEMKEAQQKATGHAANSTSLKEKLAALEKEVQGKQQFVKDARTALAAGNQRSSQKIA